MKPTPTRLIYNTQDQLRAYTHAGAALWQLPLALDNFEISQTGTRLIGRVSGTTTIVHVDLSQGTMLGNEHSLPGAMWNLAVSPSGTFSAATTKDKVLIFAGGAFVRQVDIPAKWVVSIAISDSGDVIVGAQDALHGAKVFVLSGERRGSAVIERGTEHDGVRPHVAFFPNGQRFFTNETSAFSVYSL